MAVGFKPNLGMGLQSIVAGDQPPLMKPPFAFDPSGTQMGQPKKPGFFGEGGMGRYLAGAIGDMLLQNAGYDQVFAPTMQAKREQEQAQANWGLKRQAELQDWQAKQQWEAAHPKPINNDTVNDVNWYMTATPEQKAAYHALHPQYQTIHNPDGTTTVYPMGNMGATQAPTAPVGKLTPIGGPSQPATGGFRPGR